jgi:hypothetical protein
MHAFLRPDQAGARHSKPTRESWDSQTDCCDDLMRKPLARRDKRLFVLAFPLCFHDQKGGDIHGKTDDF